MTDVFLDKTIYSHSTSCDPYLEMDIDESNVGLTLCNRVASHLGGGG